MGWRRGRPQPGVTPATASSGDTAGAPAFAEYNPDPDLALGSGGWARTNNDGVWTIAAGSFTGSHDTPPDANDRVTGTGANGTALIAAIPSSTPLVVRVTVANWVAGSVKVTLKGGTAVDMGVTGNGVFEKTITSGSNTASIQTKLTGVTTNEFDGQVTRWSIGNF